MFTAIGGTIARGFGYFPWTQNPNCITAHQDTFEMPHQANLSAKTF
jgi:hypothetical protein